jgi:hypothetical protein
MENNFILIQKNINISTFTQEILENSNLFLLDTERQKNIFVQSETQTIYLKKAGVSFQDSLRSCDTHESVITENAKKIPLLYEWVNRFSNEVGGILGRVLIVKLKPNGRIYKHIDSGEYYRSRDRFHLVLQSPLGTIFICEEEKVVMYEGELWWFNNKKIHEVINPSDFWRIHVVFDIFGATF